MTDQWTNLLLLSKLTMLYLNAYFELFQLNLYVHINVPIHKMFRYKIIIIC